MCGRFSGTRFQGQIQREKCLRGQHSRKCRWLRDSDRCYGENPRFEDDKYRLRGTVRGICPSRPLRQRAKPTPLSRLDTPSKSCAAIDKEQENLWWKSCILLSLPKSEQPPRNQSYVEVVFHFMKHNLTAKFYKPQNTAILIRAVHGNGSADCPDGSPVLQKTRMRNEALSLQFYEFAH